MWRRSKRLDLCRLHADRAMDNERQEQNPAAPKAARMPAPERTQASLSVAPAATPLLGWGSGAPAV
jgi:hypothetical protein